MVKCLMRIDYWMQRSDPNVHLPIARLEMIDITHETDISKARQTSRPPWHERVVRVRIVQEVHGHHWFSSVNSAIVQLVGNITFANDLFEDGGDDFNLRNRCELMMRLIQVWIGIGDSTY
jgi:hypothetical protein